MRQKGFGKVLLINIMICQKMFRLFNEFSKGWFQIIIENLSNVTGLWDSLYFWIHCTRSSSECCWTSGSSGQPFVHYYPQQAPNEVIYSLLTFGTSKLRFCVDFNQVKIQLSSLNNLGILIMCSTYYSDGFGSKILIQVELGWFFVGSGQPSLVWVWKISNKSIKLFNFSLGQKNLFGSGEEVPGSKTGQPLISLQVKITFD